LCWHCPDDHAFPHEVLALQDDARVRVHAACDLDEGPVGWAQLDERRHDLAVAHKQDRRLPLGTGENLEGHQQRVLADLDEQLDPRVHAGLQQIVGFGMSISTPMVRVRGSSACTTRATLPENCRPGYASVVRRTTSPMATRDTSRSGTSSCTLTGLISCSVRMPIDALLVAAAWLLTAAPTSRLRWEMNPLKGATMRVSSKCICAIRWAERCCSIWVSASWTWLSVVAIWTRAASTWASWAATAAWEAS